MGLYDDIRILQHKEELVKIKSGKAGECIPLHIRIEPTEVCNFQCEFCWWHNNEKRKTFTSLNFSGTESIGHKRLLSLIDELDELGTKAISFTGAGDPLMYPRFYEILEKIIDKKIVFGITSNMAMPMNPQLIKAMSHANWLRWSLNAGSPEKYLTTANPKGRSPDRAFSRAQENIREINIQIKKRKKYLDFNASYVVTRHNESDILNAAEIANNLSMTSIAFRPETPFDRQGQTNFYSKTAIDFMQQAQKIFQSDIFQVYINDIRQEDVLKTGDAELLCFYSNHTAYIDARGDVYPCCYTRYHSRYAVGNILDKNFKIFWHSDVRKNFYKKLLQDACPSCGYGPINTALKALYIEKTHVKDVFVQVKDKDFFI